MKQEERLLLVESSDDLWYLSHLIDPEDRVKGKTERKIKIGKEGDRNMNVVRKPVTLTVKVEKVEFQEYGSNLKVLGTIVDGPDDVPRGDHHSFSVEIGDQLWVKKEAWLPYHLEQLKDATKQAGTILICLFDREEAAFYLLERKGIQLLSRLKGSVQKKDYESKEGKDFWQEIVKQVCEYDKKHKSTTIILGSPAFWKDYVLKVLSDDVKKKVIPTSCSDLGEGGVKEIMKRPELKAALEKDKTAKEEALVESALAALPKSMLAYGLQEVREAAEQGNAKVVLVTTECIQKARQEEKYKELDQVLKQTSQSQGEVHILTLITKKIDALGGIAAIKRWSS